MCVSHANVQVDHVAVGGFGNLGSSLMKGQSSLKGRSGEQCDLKINRQTILY